MSKVRYPVIDGYKVCSKCGEQKPISEFYQRRTGEGRFCHHCKDCSRKNAHEYYLNHKAKVRKQQKEAYRKIKKLRELYNKGQLDKGKTSPLLRNLEKCYPSDYIEQRFLKRFKESRKNVQDKLDTLLRKIQEKGFKSVADMKKQESYEVSLARWDSKIMQVEDLLTIYKACKREPEREEQEPTTVNNMEEQKPTSARMTKAALINLLSDVPNDAHIIYVGDTENRLSLVAAWRSDPHSVCIRNLHATMLHIITQGALYELVSGTIPFPECPKKEDLQ